MHGLPVSCPFNFLISNLKQQWSHIGVFICYQNIEAKKKLNLHIYCIHLFNPYKTVVSHLKRGRRQWQRLHQKTIIWLVDWEKKSCCTCGTPLSTILWRSLPNDNAKIEGFIVTTTWTHNSKSFILYSWAIFTARAFLPVHLFTCSVNNREFN